VGEITRRRFLAGAGAVLAAGVAAAQSSARDYRVAIVLTTSPIAEMVGPDPVHPLTRVILHELRALGYTEGGNLVFERRSAEGDPRRYPVIVNELIASKTDVIILSGNRELIRVAQAATRSVPMVLLNYMTPVEDGFAQSLARPGMNITGPTGAADRDVYAKSMQLFKEALPRLSRAALLAPNDFHASPDGQYVREAGAKLGIEVLAVEQHPTDPRVSFASIAQLHVDGLFCVASSTNYAQRESIGRLALAARLPAISGLYRITETGGLMSYSINVPESMRRVAHYVDKILKGADPAELPMERPDKYELVINLRTAKALGISIPPSILLRADRVIE